MSVCPVLRVRAVRRPPAPLPSAPGNKVRETHVATGSACEGEEKARLAASSLAGFVEKAWGSFEENEQIGVRVLCV